MNISFFIRFLACLSSKKEAGFPKRVSARSTNVHESCGSIGGESNLLEGSNGNYMTFMAVAVPCFNLSIYCCKDVATKPF